MINSIWQEASAFSWVEWAATLTALGYVWLTSRQKTWGWWWGVISCALWAYASYAIYNLYSDALLQVFYVIMGVWGWYQWKYGGDKQQQLPLSNLSNKQHALLIGCGAAAAVISAYLFDTFTSSAAPWWNAPLTVFSILATFLLIQKKWESWFYWMLIDGAYVVFYSSQDAYLFAAVMFVYVIIATKAYFSWRADFRKLQRINL